MAKQQIQGLYDIIADISGAFVPVKITNNNRQHGVNATISTHLNFKVVTFSSGTETVEFDKEKIIYIKRAKLITNGAEKLRTGLNSLFAAIVGIQEYSSDPLEAPLHLNSFVLKFPEFNKWFDFNIPFEPFKTDIKSDKVLFQIAYPVTQISFDDYNIQNSYVGQDIKFYIELEIDTAGIYVNGELI